MAESAGGEWIPGEEEEDLGKPPDSVMKLLEGQGKEGIIVNGVLAWIMAHKEEGANGIWKQIAEHHYGDKEVLEARNLLKKTNPVLEEKVPNMSKGRMTTSKSHSIDDISNCFQYLGENSLMPMVLATAEQWRMSPQNLGSMKPQATMGEMASKVQKLEEIMGEFMASSNRKMETITEIVKKNEKEITRKPEKIVKEKSTEDVVELINRPGVARAVL